MNYPILYIAIILALLGCAEDKGNYDYLELNKIGIDSIHEKYTVERYDSLKITPKLTFSLEEEELAYEWKIDYKTVSTERNLNIEVKADYGEKAAALVVTLKENRTQYFHDFQVNILPPFDKGLYMLNEQPDATAVLSFLKAQAPSKKIITHLFEEINPGMGTLGKKPKQVFYYNFFNEDELNILCGEGDKKMTVLTRSTLAVKRFLNENTIFGGFEGHFSPSFLQVYYEGGLVSEGKFYFYNYTNSGSLYRPAMGDYDLADWITSAVSFTKIFWIGYDRIKQNFKVFEVGDTPLAFDKVSDLETELSTVGQQFIGAGYVASDNYQSDKRVILFNKQENKAYFYQLKAMGEYVPPTWEVQLRLGLELLVTKENLVDANSVCILGRNSYYWYIATRNEVFRMHASGEEVEVIFTSESGPITALELSGDEMQLYIATYDADSKQLNKGKLYLLDIEDKTIKEDFPLDCEKVVSMINL